MIVGRMHAPNLDIHIKAMSTFPPHQFLQTESLFGEFLFYDRSDKREDVYVIGLEYSDNQPKIYSRYICREDQSLREMHYYPQSLTELKIASQYDPGTYNFYKSLDTSLVHDLIACDLDSLSVYAAVHNHPELRWLITKPMLL